MKTTRPPAWSPPAAGPAARRAAANNQGDNEDVDDKVAMTGMTTPAALPLAAPTATTKYLTLPQVAGQLPAGRTGKPAYSSTIARWIIHGVRITGGRRVMLRGVRLPGGWRTRQEWVDAFLEELTRASLEEGRRPKADPLDTPMRRFEIEQEQKTLAAMGL